MSASVSLAVTTLVPLAKEVDENKVTPGVLGFIVFAVLALAVWGLMKSMNKHMQKVDFKEAPDTEAEQAGNKADSPAQRG
jgi:Ca2+/H+ antiporter